LGLACGHGSAALGLRRLRRLQNAKSRSPQKGERLFFIWTKKA